MDTTAPAGAGQDSDPQRLLDQLADVDAAEAPEIADSLARILADAIETSADAGPTQLSAELDAGAGP